MFFRNLKISHKMFIGFGLITIIMLAVIGYSYFSFVETDKTLDLNIETYGIITMTGDIMESMLNMETGVRGYALTGKEEFLEPYKLGKKNYEKYFDLVKDATLDNLEHQDRLSRLSESYEHWIEWANKTVIQGRQDVGSGLMKLEDLIIAAQKGQGKKDIDNIRSIIDEIIKEEEGVLSERFNDLNNLKGKTVGVMSLGGLLATILAVFTAFFITGTVVRPVNALRKTFVDISKGEGDYKFRLNIDSNDELGQMSEGFNEFMDKIEIIIIENSNEDWIKTGQNGLNKKLSGVQDIELLTRKGIEYITKYVGGQSGAMYLNNGNNEFTLLSSYPYGKDKDLKVKNILITPCTYDNNADIVIEIGKVSEFTDLEVEFIERISEIIAVSVHSVLANNRMEELLMKTLEQSEELHDQQEKLRQGNKELEEQSALLKLKIIELTELKDANYKLENLSLIDGLTGIGNRRSFDKYIEMSWKNAIRSKKPLSLIMGDIDFFKLLNDRYGHLKGDECLRKVAKTLTSNLKRPTDFVARYGGEEFIIVLPETNSEGAFSIAEKIREKIEELKVPNEDSSVSKYMTMSFGVATIYPSLEDTIEDFIGNSDKALYKSKEMGRNMVSVS